MVYTEENLVRQEKKYLPSVFNVNKRPWIYLNGALREDCKRVIHNCPSDALKFIDKRTVQ